MTLKTILMMITILFISVISHARDYKIEIFKENYKEKLIPGGGELKLYHTWQAKTVFGNKLLVLVGNDSDYRNWLRESLKKNKLYIVKIPKQGENAFENDLAIPVDIQQIHPVWDEKWDCSGCRHGNPEEEPQKNM
ncbi:MAG: hypothetical protein KJ737_07055 [Proteobacteria bacterium]|nr:hypothetical protein [Pseudomonadota bacterium]